MHLDQLKKGLWGYRKDSVFQYIASQEEVFSQKLLEKDAQAEGAARQYQERIQALEEENRKLRQKLAEQTAVARAKCLLIEFAHMTEEQAHKYIEKQAMDSRLPKAEIASEIVRTYAE